MNAEPENEASEGRQAELMAAAQAAVAYSANSLRSIRESFRTAHADQVSVWDHLRDALSESRSAPMGISGDLITLLERLLAALEVGE